jgi:hypothetical protein
MAGSVPAGPSPTGRPARKASRAVLVTKVDGDGDGARRGNARIRGRGGGCGAQNGRPWGLGLTIASLGPSRTAWD